MTDEILLLVFVALLCCGSNLPAATVKDLEAGREWRVEEISISGNVRFSESELLAAILTRARPWYLPWESRPLFDPVTFTEDLERLRRFYESHGYFEARVSYKLEINQEDSLVAARIEIEEDQPVIVSEVRVEGTGAAPTVAVPPLPPELPIKRGQIFTEEAYQKTEQFLREFLLQHGYAYAATERKAEVDLEQNRVRILYSVDAGPPSVFGETVVEGAQDVAPELALRELTYRPGDQFSLDKITESRDKIVRLDLFSAVRIAPQPITGKPMVVPMQVTVVEKPPRDLRIGVGYGTEDEFRAQVEWQHRNWLGGGRRVSVLGKYSSIEITGQAKFIQPHFFSPRTQAIASFRQDRGDEETFLLHASRFNPRIEHAFTDKLAGFVGYRLEFHTLDKIDAATEDALGEVTRKGLISGPSVGMVWNTTDNPLNPKSGEMVSVSLDHSGEIWGGKFDFYKLAAEARKYLPLGWETVLATRLKIGIADALGKDKDYPLPERFFSGGEKSVRGFGRRRLGPLSASDDPIGGLSLIEGSFELRRPLWREIGGALFLDFGQVSRRAFDIPVDDLKFSAGFGFSYATLIGPMRLDVGFPFKPPKGDRPWQVHFSIGAFF
ncbi:MAG: outer membrane protein assembly factor BamA [Deltaproteobacteria bacterium]|nr:outer membrane protein assembly factor BamA [Deltaproteobacteria bacterium]